MDNAVIDAINAPKAWIDVTHEHRSEHFAYHANERVAELRDEAVGRFDIADVPGRFSLFTTDGIVIDGELTLIAAGIAPDSHLELLKKDIEVIYNGRTEEFNYKRDELVGDVLRKALERFHVTNNAHLMSLFNAANVELKENQSLGAAGVRPGQTLVLRQSVVKGG